MDQKFKYVEGVYVNLIQSPSNLQYDDKQSSWRLNAKQYSNWQKLIRVQSRVNRFIYNC